MYTHTHLYVLGLVCAQMLYDSYLCGCAAINVANNKTLWLIMLTNKLIYK